jgi:hypothetical protein
MRILWAGFSWTVEHDNAPAAGTKNPSRDNVIVDTAGRLHLLLRPNVNGIWGGMQMLSDLDMGFGMYQWQVEGRPDLFDPNVIFGMFQYPRDWQNAAGYDEWDFEWAKWGNAARAYNMDLSINPNRSHPDADRVLKMLSIDLPSTLSTYRVRRTNRSMTFEIFGGHIPVDETSTPLANWHFAPSDPTLVSQVPQRTIMNLWLNQGVPPLDGQPVEIIVSSFSFTPDSGVEPQSSTMPLLVAAGLLLSIAGMKK